MKSFHYTFLVLSTVCLFMAMGCQTIPPRSFLPENNGWRSKMIRETRLTVSYKNTTILDILQDIGQEGVDGVFGGPGLERRIDFSATNATIREILWKLSTETGMKIKFYKEIDNRGFLLEVPNADGTYLRSGQGQKSCTAESCTAEIP